MLEYLKFTRVRRNQCVRTVVSTFEETMDSRLNEGTFTAEEVKEMISGNVCDVKQFRPLQINSLLVTALYFQALIYQDY